MKDKNIYKQMRGMISGNTISEICKYLEISKRQYYKILDEGSLLQILDLQKDNKSDKEIYEYLGIKEDKYYGLLDKNYLCQIKDLEESGWHTKDIRKYLKIKKKKYYELKNDMSPKKKNGKTIISRDDEKYTRIDNYRNDELHRGIIVEAITRIHDSEEVFQTRELSSLIELIQKDIQPIINIKEDEDIIAYYMGMLNNKIENFSNKNDEQVIIILKTRDHFILNLKTINSKIKSIYNLKDCQQMIDIQKIENITVVNKKNINNKKIYNNIKKKIQILNAKIKRKSDISDNLLAINLQDIKYAMMSDKERIKEEIIKVSNSSHNISNKKLEKRLKNNAHAIRMAMHIFELEKSLISKIFKKISISNYTSIAVINYNHCDFNEKSYIDILNEQIDDGYHHYFDEDNKNIKKKNIELVKHYLLKYIQKPLLKYGMDYSNTLLDEYNFQKVSLEIDMTIPEEDQKKLIDDMLTELYKMKLPFRYSEFMGQTLLKDLDDEKFNVVHKGRKASKNSPLAERVSSLFYIYDLRKRGVIVQECIKSLSSFYEYKNRDYVVDDKTFEIWYEKILAFMNEFEKKYKIQSAQF